MNVIQIVLDDNAVMCSTAQKLDRQTICNTCPSNVNNFCTSCGCVLEVRTAYLVLDCPLQKWSVNK